VARVHYRDGLNVNNLVGASGTFNPSTDQSGKQWRLMPFFLTYTTPELFGVKDFLTLSGGWINAYDIFAQQPESEFFRNMRSSARRGLARKLLAVIGTCRVGRIHEDQTC
jgi:porin